MNTRQRVLRFIEGFRAKKFFGPTTREIAGGVGLASNSTVAMHLETLRREGLITWDEHDGGEMITRSVRLTLAGREIVHQPPPPPVCPECGSQRYFLWHSPRGKWRRCNECGHVEALEEVRV